MKLRERLLPLSHVWLEDVRMAIEARDRARVIGLLRVAAPEYAPGADREA